MMDMKLDLRIVQLMCSRVCHDFAGVVGAVNNGMELIQELGDDVDPEAITLVSQSAKDMAARLQYYRVAFGLAPGAARSVGEARSLADAYFANGRVSVDWAAVAVDPHQPCAESELKLLLNLLLLGADGVPRGGVLGVELAPAGGRLSGLVKARGEGARIGDEIRVALDRSLETEEVTARTVQGYFAARLAEQIEMELAATQSEANTVTLGMRPRSGA